MNELLLGRYYSFAVLAVGYLGTDFTNVRVDAVLDYDSVRLLNLIDPVVAHQSVFPSLLPGTPNDPKGYRYYKLTFSNGSTTAIGVPWVDYSSVTEITTNDYRFTVPSVTPDGLNNIRAALAAIGYSIASAEQIT